MLTAVIFDMDGVLIDSEPFWQRAQMAVFAELGHFHTEEDCNSTIGVRIDQLSQAVDKRQKCRKERCTLSLNSALRSLHEPAILDAKREAAQRLLDTVPPGGGKFELSEEDAHAWASAVNDVRLALGTMLDIGAESPDRLPGDHPMAGHLDVYQWLTVLQEYLVICLMGRQR